MAHASLQLRRRRGSPVRSVQMADTVHRTVSRRAGAHVARRHRGEDAGCPDPVYTSTGVDLISSVAAAATADAADAISAETKVQGKKKY